MWGLAALGVVRSGLLDHVAPAVRFLVVFALLSLLPGELLLKMLAVRSQRGLRLPLVFVSGMSLAAVVTWICWMGGASIRAYTAILQIVVAVLLVAALVFRRHDADRAQGIGEALAGVWQRVGIIALVLVVSVFFYLSPPPVDYQGDAFAHLGFVRSIIAGNTFTPAPPLAPPVLAKTFIPKSDPRMGTLHPFLAAVATLANMSPVEVWRMLPVAVAPMAVLAFIAFAGVLLPGPVCVAFAAVLFLMFQGGIGRDFLATVGYGQHLSLIVMWTFVVMCVRYARDGSRGILLLLGLVALGGSLIHIDGVIHCGLACASFVLFYRAFGFTARRVLALALTAGLCVSAAVGWKIITSYGAGNIVHTHPQGLLFLSDIGDRFFVPNPGEILRTNGLLFFAGLFFVPFLPFLRKHRRLGMMGLALSVPPILTALNPLVCPFFYAKGHYLVQRFVLNIPSLVITSLVIGSIVVWGRGVRIWGKIAAGLVLFVWAKVFVLGAGVWLHDARAVRLDRHSPVLSSEVSDAFRFINERTPEGSVVLTDAMTSYALSAFTHARVVTVLGQHGNPNDQYPVERLWSVHRALSPYTSQMETLDVIRLYGVDYVLVNGAFDGPYHDFLADWDPGFVAVLEQKLGRMPAVFKRVYRTDRVLVYEVQGTSIERTSWEAEVPCGQGSPANVARCALRDTTAGAWVSGLGVERMRVLPGETISLVVAYRKRLGAEPRFPLELRLRFEDKTYFERARKFPGDKIVRRFRERQDGVFRRFRFDHEPFGGYIVAREWSDLGECTERVELRLPRGLAEANYEIQWQLVEQPLLPNLSVRDFLFNDDSYRGDVCGEIEVRRTVIR